MFSYKIVIFLTKSANWLIPRVDDFLQRLYSLLCYKLIVNIYIFLGKSYHSIQEEIYRRNVFKKNTLVIEEHNKEYNLGKKSYTLGNRKKTSS
jgi:predicted patatin/cPLA2 family phospholipase